MNAFHTGNPNFYDDEYERDFKRPEPFGSRLHRQRLLNMARNVRFLAASRLSGSGLGRRTLSHLLLHLRRGSRGEE